MQGEAQLEYFNMQASSHFVSLSTLITLSAWRRFSLRTKKFKEKALSRLFTTIEEAAHSFLAISGNSELQ